MSLTRVSGKHMKAFNTPDGTSWGVEVQLPSYSSSNVVFHHPDGRSAGKDRYVRFEWRGPEAANVTTAVDAARVMGALDEKTLRELFIRSMPIALLGGRPAFSPA